MQNRNQQNRFVRAVKKFFLSAFVIASFTAYALQNRSSAGQAMATQTGAITRAATNPPRTAASSAAAAPAAGVSAPTAQAAAPTTALAAPTAEPAAPTAEPAEPTAEPAEPTAAPAAPTAEPAAPSVASSTTGSGYKDGTFTGPAVDVRWGYVQVQATIQGGQISDVQFLQYPNDRRTSVRINSIAGPELQQEAVQAQSANVDIITGATLTSEGFQQSLEVALNQAQG